MASGFKHKHTVHCPILCGDNIARRFGDTKDNQNIEIWKSR